MESYRVYKSLSLDDFMDNVQFVTAKSGLLIAPLIQDINYKRHQNLQSEDFWKRRFMDNVQDLLNHERHNLNGELRVTDMGSFGYWEFLPVQKKKYAVLQNDTYDSYSEVVYLFENYEEAVEWIQKVWEDRYNQMLAEQLMPVCNARVDERGCWHQDEYAQICYSISDDDEPAIYKRYWNLIPVSEPLKFGN